MNVDNCPHCKRAMNIHKFTFTKSLANAVMKISKSVGMSPFNTKDLRDRGIISTSDFTNITHLKYFGIVVKDEKRHWRITNRGVALIAGRPSVKKFVKVFDDKIVEESDDYISIKQAVGYYEPPEEWAARIEHPVLSDGQQSFI